ncbi:MAG TPA: NAD-dependent epimerase/dehydratase family protein [Candidatus Thermoplasmatota archaeon]|nr:NAD-dependent epimerase/dehydratase family protein [Candidatus Thermoplasmatota archaeon]
MRVLVTGGAGFIGHHLALRLRALGHEVVVLDNLAAPHAPSLAALSNAKVELVRGDLLVPQDVAGAARGCEAVFHLAANPDVRATSSEPGVAFEANVVATHELLEVLRVAQPRSIVFTSTSTVYGEARQIPTPETYAPLEPISAYGATKLACEALLAAHAHTTGQRCTVLRLANITGPRATHGVAVDFVAKLRRDPTRLEILGDGTQRKSYCHVEDTVEGLIAAWQGQRSAWEAFNLGSDDSLDVRAIADLACQELGLRDVADTFKPAAGGRGWLGDVKRMQLDSAKLRALGWRPKHSSADAVRAAVRSAMQG